MKLFSFSTKNIILITLALFYLFIIVTSIFGFSLEGMTDTIKESMGNEEDEEQENMQGEDDEVEQENMQGEDDEVEQENMQGEGMTEGNRGLNKSNRITANNLRRMFS